MPPWLVALMQRLRGGQQAEPTLPGVEAKPPWESHPDPMLQEVFTSGLADTLFTAFGRPQLGQDNSVPRVMGIYDPHYDFFEAGRRAAEERGTPPGGAIWMSTANRPRQGPVPDRRPTAGYGKTEDVEWVFSHEMGHKAYNEGINDLGRKDSALSWEPYSYVLDLPQGKDLYSSMDPRERWAQTFANAVEAYRVLHSADLTKNRQAMDAMMVDREKKMPGTAYVMQWMSQATDLYSKHPAAGYAAEWATRFDTQYRTLARSK